LVGIGVALTKGYVFPHNSFLFVLIVVDWGRNRKLFLNRGLVFSLGLRTLSNG
jgi:hypothetical protein